MALVCIEENNDSWFVEYEACEKLLREIMETLTSRAQEPRTSQAYASLSANIRLRMKQYSGEVKQLKIKVDEASRSRAITAEEAERRLRQVEQLQSKDIQIQQLYESRTNDLTGVRTKLLSSTAFAFADGGTTSWGLDEDDDQPLDVHISVDDLKKQQERLIQEQDQGLEELSKVITRQKEIAQTIHTEVDNQNEIIDDLAEHMDRTDARLIDGTRRVQTIDRKDWTCGYWVVIVLLFISIIAVALV